MALNPNYESIGKAFTEQYYGLFDDPARRPQLVNLYNVSYIVFFSLVCQKTQQHSKVIVQND